MNQVLGGIIIGLAATVMLLFTGKVTGISGMVGGVLNTKTPNKSWRVFFILGLILGGAVLKIMKPEFFTFITSARPYDFIIAGFLVGFGTLLGNGCTSGHGVCGISRFSPRSIVATITFISAGVLSMVVFKWLKGEL